MSGERLLSPIGTVRNPGLIIVSLRPFRIAAEEDDLRLAVHRHAGMGHRWRVVRRNNFGPVRSIPRPGVRAIEPVPRGNSLRSSEKEKSTLRGVERELRVAAVRRPSYGVQQG